MDFVFGADRFLVRGAVSMEVIILPGNMSGNSFGVSFDVSGTVESRGEWLRGTADVSAPAASDYHCADVLKSSLGILTLAPTLDLRNHNEEVLSSCKRGAG